MILGLRGKSGADLKSDGVDLRPRWVDFRSVRSTSRPRRLELWPTRPDLRSRGQGGRNKQTNR